MLSGHYCSRETGVPKATKGAWVSPGGFSPPDTELRFSHYNMETPPMNATSTPSPVCLSRGQPGSLLQSRTQVLLLPQAACVARRLVFKENSLADVLACDLCGHPLEILNNV